MEFYWLMLFGLLSGFMGRELYVRYILKKKIKVIIEKADGTTVAYEVYAGRDPDVDRLLKEAKALKKAA